MLSDSHQQKFRNYQALSNSQLSDQHSKPQSLIFQHRSGHAGPSVKAVSLYKLWPGRTSWCCNGMVRLGPRSDWKYLVSGWGGLISLFLVYTLILAPKIWVTRRWLVIGSFCTWLLVIYFYMRCCLLDPGYIPPRTILHLVDAQTKGAYRKRVASSLGGDLNKEWNIYFAYCSDASYNRGKMCETCNLPRPPLSTHCSTCDVCVRCWDHHCNWVANCIGQRNHRSFVCFMIFTPCFFLCYVSSTALFMWETWNEHVSSGRPLSAGLLHSSSVVPLDAGPASSVAITLLIFSGAMGILALLAGLLVFRLTYKHIKRVAGAQTTKSRLREGPPSYTQTWRSRLCNLTTFFTQYSTQPSLLTTDILNMDVEPGRLEQVTVGPSPYSSYQ
eukprot:g35589.t1